MPQCTPSADRSSLAAVSTGDPAMTPFGRVERSVTTSMIERATMLAQPAEVYRPMFGGRTPTLAEKIQFVEVAIQRMTSMHVYENNLYHVEIVYGQPFIHLDIHRLDRGACKDWRHFQQIKNELIGPEHEAVELFPAESRLVDTANEYHMWVHADPSYRFPFGFGKRWVLESAIKSVMAAEKAGGEARPIGTDRVGRLQKDEIGRMRDEKGAVTFGEDSSLRTSMRPGN